MNKCRYIRQSGILGNEGQHKLATTRILCIGAGGLGTLVSSFLVGAGVNIMGLIDNDIIEITNLNRQLSYSEKDCGSAKVQILKAYLQQRNSNCKITIYDYHLQPGNAERLIEEYDLIIDCSDNFSTKYLISDLCCLKDKPLVSASIDGFSGQVLTLMPNMCYRCIFPNAVNTSTCTTNDVIGPAVGIIASIQANEIIKLITGLKQGNQLLQVDTLDNTIDRFELGYDSTCINNHDDDFFIKYTPYISYMAWNKVLKIASQSEIIIIDIRRNQSQSLPVKTLSSSYEEITQLKLLKNQGIVIICNFGQRSKLAALKLAATGYSQVFYSHLLI